MTDTSLNLNSYNNYVAPNQGDAWAYLQSILDSYGLSSLDDVAHSSIVNGLSNTQTVQAIRQTDTYKTRFAAIIQLQAKGLPAISEQNVLDNEAQYTAIAQAAHLPSGFYDSPEDFVDFIVKGVSPTEFQDRIVKGYQAVDAAPAETKNFLTQNFGMNQGDMAAYFLDPDKTEDLLTRQVTAAQIGGAAARTGFGQINGDQALALQGLGVTGDQAQTGFNQLAAERQLMNTLPGEAGNDISNDTQVAAEFGQNADAQTAIKNRQAQRVAALGGGGQFSTNKEGFAGVGNAR